MTCRERARFFFFLRYRVSIVKPRFEALWLWRTRVSTLEFAETLSHCFILFSIFYHCKRRTHHLKLSGFVEPGFFAIEFAFSLDHCKRNINKQGDLNLSGCGHLGFAEPIRASLLFLWQIELNILHLASAISCLHPQNLQIEEIENFSLVFLPTSRYDIAASAVPSLDLFPLFKNNFLDDSPFLGLSAKFRKPKGWNLLLNSS